MAEQEPRPIHPVHNPKSVRQQFDHIKQLARMGVELQSGPSDAQLEKYTKWLGEVGDRFTCPRGYSLQVLIVNAEMNIATPPQMPWDGHNRTGIGVEPPSGDDPIPFIATEIVINQTARSAWLVDDTGSSCTPFKNELIIILNDENGSSGGTSGDREPRVPYIPPNAMSAALELGR